MTLEYLSSDAFFALDKVDTLESDLAFIELRPLEVTEGVFLLVMADWTLAISEILQSLFPGNSGALSISVVVRAMRRQYIWIYQKSVLFVAGLVADCRT